MMAQLKKIDELPKEKLALLSQYEKDRMKYWFYSMHGGVSYVIPVDKDMNKLIKKVGLWDFENVIRDVIGAIYLQTRLAIGDGIEMMLSQQIDAGFRRLYSPNLRKKIEERFNLLEFKEDKASKSTTDSKKES